MGNETYVTLRVVYIVHIMITVFGTSNTHACLYFNVGFTPVQTLVSINIAVKTIFDLVLAGVVKAK